MKACVQCGRLYPDDAGFCPIDGQQLTNVSQAPVPAGQGDMRLGTILSGRYQVRRVVADGGMGRVYEAFDMVAQRNVALKVLHPGTAEDEVALERFKREFEVSNLLPHQHVVEVFDFQPTGDGSYALVMEFLYGEELRSTLKREGTLSPARLVRMMSQLALGLDAAHERRLVHRDLKPENIFLCQTREGDTVKILDFGSVKDRTINAKKLTVMGTTIGSPFYMSPEQAQGLETLDHRADVWALAAIAYECVVGQVPFPGRSGPAILLEILTKTPTPPTRANAQPKYPVPWGLDGVMRDAFQKSAAQRTASVGLLADRLGQTYGLSGDHRGWALRTQEDLEAEIQSRIQEIMTPPSSKELGDGLSDSFFGKDIGAAVGAISPQPRSPSERPSESPQGVPKAGSNWMWVLAVLAILITIVIAVILMFTL